MWKEKLHEFREYDLRRWITSIYHFLASVAIIAIVLFFFSLQFFGWHQTIGLVKYFTTTKKSFEIDSITFPIVMNLSNKFLTLKDEIHVALSKNDNDSIINSDDWYAIDLLGTDIRGTVLMSTVLSRDIPCLGVLGESIPTGSIINPCERLAGDFSDFVSLSERCQNNINVMPNTLMDSIAIKVAANHDSLTIFLSGVFMSSCPGHWRSWRNKHDTHLYPIFARMGMDIEDSVSF